MKPARLLNPGFMVLNLFILLAFCNLAVFYNFYNYLDTLSVPVSWRGALIGLFPVSAMILRPMISPVLTPQNAVKSMAAGLGMIVVCLCLYGSAVSLKSLIVLRILHGVGYVILISAGITLMVKFIPAHKSGQGFGLVSVMTLLPYAIVPLVVEKGFPTLPQSKIYIFMAMVLLFSSVLLIPLKRLALSETQNMYKEEALPSGSLMTNIRQVNILILLLVNGLVFSAFSLVFFFLKTFADQSGIGDAGLFFTLSTLAMIVSRITMGPLFDRFDKAAMTMAGLGVFSASLWLLGLVTSAGQFYTVALVYGLGVGVATPLLNGLMFMVSAPEYRGLNTNLMMEMVDAGFFMGPIIGGLAVAAGIQALPILIGCSCISLLAAGLMIPFIGKT